MCIHEKRDMINKNRKRKDKEEAEKERVRRRLQAKIDGQAAEEEARTRKKDRKEMNQRRPLT